MHQGVDSRGGDLLCSPKRDEPLFNPTHFDLRLQQILLRRDARAIPGLGILAELGQQSAIFLGDPRGLEREIIIRKRGPGGFREFKPGGLDILRCCNRLRPSRSTAESPLAGIWDLLRELGPCRLVDVRRPRRPRRRLE